jgi:hypothetical protein
MSGLVENLRAALRRRPPPDGFAERVLARARDSRARRRRSAIPPWTSWTIAAAAVLTLAVGSVLYQKRERDAEGAKAKEDVMHALRLTGAKLRTAQERVFEIHERTIQLQTN